MTRGRFDDRCPHCEEKMFDSVYSVWQDADYAHDFDVNCPKCDAVIDVHVHTVPEFELSKGQTPEEYADMVAAMKRHQQELLERGP